MARPVRRLRHRWRPRWRGIDRYGARPGSGALRRSSIAEIVRCRAAAVGLADAQVWVGAACAAGVPERDVQRHGRWQSRASMDPYIDAARTLDPTNPTHSLGPGHWMEAQLC